MTSDLYNLITGVLAGLSAFWIYYRVFRGSSLKLGVFLSVLVGGISFFVPSVGRILAFILFSIGIMLEMLGFSRKKQFTHSQFLYEGGGVRRGLSPVEVGVIFNLDSSNLFSLGLIELLQKGLINYQLLSGREILIRPIDELGTSKSILNPLSRRETRKQVAFSLMSELTDPEDVLLEIFIQNSQQPLGGYSIQPWVDYLSRNVAMKLSGYDISQTKTYYLAYIVHRLEGVMAGHFDRLDYINWAVLNTYIENDKLNHSFDILDNSHPEWILEGGSLVEFIEVVKSATW